MSKADAIRRATPGLLRRPGKRVLRQVGIATARWRPLPGYLIIGAHRAGSTSLWAYLSQHPCIAANFPRLQGVKGVRYFDEHYWRGDSWYRSHFPTTSYLRRLSRRGGCKSLAGDASSYYLFHPAAPARAASVVPGAKLIVLLRDPVSRAYSHWRRERRDGMEPLARFEEAVEAEEERLAGEVDRILNDERYYSYAHENFSYLTQGLYLESLKRWLEYYPREQMHVEVSERFSARPQEAYDRVLEFLGLPAMKLLDASPQNTSEGDPLDPAVRRKLHARVAPENARLEEFLGFELGWNGGEER